MANVIHRTRDEAVYDGSSGQQIDTVTYHELGIEVDGVFVPFATKQGSYVDALVSRGKEAQKAEQHTPSNAPQQQQTSANPTEATYTQTGTAGTPSATDTTTGAPQAQQVPTEPQGEQSGSTEGQ